MSYTFTKLFSSITSSTVWMEPAGTRLTWIAMLANCDRNGRVFASVPGLAHLSRVTLEEAQIAIETFLAPDPHSRTKDDEGRRITEIDGGWQLINHQKYREIRDQESIRESKRDYMRRVRAESGNKDSTDSTVDRGGPKQMQNQSQIQLPEKPKSKEKAVAVRGTRLPRDWVPTPEQLEYARARGVDGKAEAENFRDYWCAKAGQAATKTDWDLTWKTWVRRAPVSKASSVPAGKTKTEALAPSETPLERELAHMAHQYNLGAYGSGMAGKSAYEDAVKETRRKFSQ